jgi:hypothetical protein
MRNHQQSTTIAILGANAVVENALAQLLEGEGYSTKVLKTSPLREAPEEDMPLGGDVDLMILAPSLSTSECESFLAARRRRTSPHRTTPPPSSPIPVIVLCNPMKGAPAHPRRGGASREECAVAYLARAPGARDRGRPAPAVVALRRTQRERQRKKREDGIHR